MVLAARLNKMISIKSYYEWLCSFFFFAGTGEGLDIIKVEAYKKLWRNDVLLKVIIVTWILLLDKVATREALFRRGILVSTRDLCCVFCFKEIKTASHLFCRCEVMRKIWSLVLLWLDTDEDQYDCVVSSFLEFGRKLKGKKRRRVKHLIWIAVVWNIWAARNKVVFKGEVVNVKSIVMSIKYTAWVWFIAMKGRNSGALLSDWFYCPIGCLLLV